ncbi:winged helix-turn-helix transcriptional regulator [Pseudomonas sp. 9Ag]|uniref:winged helix-turn-helix transcriptional regulator n=1 Tax=Pseudomonas sp. 9Ag TaxID=2653167 RepID=UPI0035583CE7
MRLERNGFVMRTVLLTQPVRAQYAITPPGASLRVPFELFCAWSLVMVRRSITHGFPTTSRRRHKLTSHLCATYL